MDIKKLSASLLQAEGCRLQIYKDSLGYDTIGIGHLITSDDERSQYANGISMDDALELLAQDIQNIIPKLSTTFPFFDDLDDVRQRVVAEMCFNLGIQGFEKFHQTISDISSGNYSAAGDQMLNSLWAKQVKGRAVRLSNMMKSGQDPST